MTAGRTFPATGGAHQGQPQVRCPGCQSWHDRQPTRYDESGYLCLACQFPLAADDGDVEPLADSAPYEPDDPEDWTEVELAWLRAQDDPEAAERRYCALLEEAIADPALFALLAAAAAKRSSD